MLLTTRKFVDLFWSSTNLPRRPGNCAACSRSSPRCQAALAKLQTRDELVAIRSYGFTHNPSPAPALLIQHLGRNGRQAPVASPKVHVPTAPRPSPPQPVGDPRQFLTDLRPRRVRRSEPVNQRLVHASPNTRRSPSRRSECLRNLHKHSVGIVQPANGNCGASRDR
jgi:hypothetical protein